jgi:hypothetical protein
MLPGFVELVFREERSATMRSTTERIVKSANMAKTMDTSVIRRAPVALGSGTGYIASDAAIVGKLPRRRSYLIRSVRMMTV